MKKVKNCQNSPKHMIEYMRKRGDFSFKPKVFDPLCKNCGQGVMEDVGRAKYGNIGRQYKCPVCGKEHHVRPTDRIKKRG